MLSPEALADKGRKITMLAMAAERDTRIPQRPELQRASAVELLSIDLETAALDGCNRADARQIARYCGARKVGQTRASAILATAVAVIYWRAIRREGAQSPRLWRKYLKHVDACEAFRLGITVAELQRRTDRDHRTAELRYNRDARRQAFIDAVRRLGRDLVMLSVAAQ